MLVRVGFDVLVVWRMDRFSREGEGSVSRIMAALQDWHVQFYSFDEPFLDTSGLPQAASYERCMNPAFG